MAQRNFEWTKWEVVCLLFITDYTSMHGKYAPDFETVGSLMKVFSCVVKNYFVCADSDRARHLLDPYSSDDCERKIYQLQSRFREDHIDDLLEYTDVCKLLIPVLRIEKRTRLVMLCVHVNHLHPSQGAYHGNFTGDYVRLAQQLGNGTEELLERQRQVVRDSFYEIVCEHCIAVHRHYCNQNGIRFGNGQKLVNTYGTYGVDDIGEELERMTVDDLILDMRKWIGEARALHSLEDGVDSKEERIAKWDAEGRRRFGPISALPLDRGMGQRDYLELILNSKV